MAWVENCSQCINTLLNKNQFQAFNKQESQLIEVGQLFAIQILFCQDPVLDLYFGIFILYFYDSLPF